MTNIYQSFAVSNRIFDSLSDIVHVLAVHTRHRYSAILHQVNVMLLDQVLSHLLLVQASVREHADLVSDVVPCAYVMVGLPGVFIYSSLPRRAVLIEIIRLATYFSSDFHCYRFSAFESTRSAILAPWIGGLE